MRYAGGRRRRETFTVRDLGQPVGCERIGLPRDIDRKNKSTFPLKVAITPRASFELIIPQMRCFCAKGYCRAR